MKLADGFGNYLYVIFAVVYVIYSIIKAGKKVTQNRPTIDKKPQSSPTVNPPTSSLPEPAGGDDFKKILEELLGAGGEEEVPETAPRKAEPLPAVPVKPAANFLKKDKPVVSPNIPKAAVPATAFVAHPEIVEKVFSQKTEQEESEIDFDIRQAVLYSEILKRPEY